MVILSPQWRKTSKKASAQCPQGQRQENFALSPSSWWRWKACSSARSISATAHAKKRHSNCKSQCAWSLCPVLWGKRNVPRFENLNFDCKIPMRSNYFLSGRARPWPARLGRVCRFSPGLYGLSQPLPFPQSTHQWPVGFLHACRWFNKKCPKQVRWFSNRTRSQVWTAPGPVDVSSKIRHGASTTCLRLNLSPHWAPSIKLESVESCALNRFMAVR